MCKHIISLAAIALCALSAVADSEKVSLVIGSTKSLTVPFVIESFRVIPAGSEKITVEALESQLRVVAVQEGEVNVVASGGGMSREYAITVKSNLTKVLKQLRADLDALTELDISLNDDRIVIKGTVTDPDHWAVFQRVLPHYSGKCVNFAVFRPSSETIINLKKMLADAGFAFSSDGVPPKPGELQMQVSTDAIVITGELYSQTDIDRINRILATQTWLSTAGSASGGKIKGVVNLHVIETILQVDVVYVGLNENEGHSEGTGGGAPSIGNAMSAFYDIVAGKGDGTATISGSMPETITFLRNNGVTRTYNAGHVSFANNDPTGGELHTGGTIYAKVNGIENGSLQNIEYGLKINVKGGLVSPTRVKLTLELTNSQMLSRDEDAYDLAEDTTKQTVFCDLGKTLAVAGGKKLMESTAKSGLPVLRNTPVLQWFVSGDSNSGSGTRLLILVCPRLASHNPDVQIEIPLEQETATTKKDAEETNAERIEKKKKFQGALYFLNWFVW